MRIKILSTLLTAVIVNFTWHSSVGAHNRVVVVPLIDTEVLIPYAPVANTHPAASSYFTNAINPNVLDYTTGLIWQKEDDATIRTFGDALAYCRDLATGGSRWRLPSLHELLSIVHYGRPGPDTPSISTVFVGAAEDGYWTATADANLYLNQYLVHFENGNVTTDSRNNSYYTRCVNDSTGLPGNFKDLGNGVIEDLATGLNWQKQDNGVAMQWSVAIAYCNDLMLGNKQDWQMPNIKELHSIADQRLGDEPTIDQKAFPNTNSPYKYWSRTTNTNNNSSAFWHNFGTLIFIGSVNKSSTAYVRCVR